MRGATQQAAGSDCRAGADLKVSRCLILLVFLLLELGHLVLVRVEVVMLVLVVTGCQRRSHVSQHSRPPWTDLGRNTAEPQDASLTTKRRRSTSILVKLAAAT